MFVKPLIATPGTLGMQGLFLFSFILASPWTSKRVAVHVDSRCTSRLRRADGLSPLTVFDTDVTKASEGGCGDVAVVFGPKDKKSSKALVLGVGLFDPLSPLRVRFLVRGASTAPVDDGWVAAALNAAIAERKAIFDDDEITTGYRLCNGEHDGLHGLVIDRYGSTIVIKCYAACWLPWCQVIVKALAESPHLRACSRFMLLMSREMAALPAAERFDLQHGQVLRGPPLDAVPGDADGRVAVFFLENRIQYECDPVNGQKTGFFLDQRDNRYRVREMAKAIASRGRHVRVLNVFSYTGGFSLAAAAGGASEVVSVDLSRPALEALRRNFEANGATDRAIASCRHSEVASDAFEAMESMVARGELFDIVIVDPPAFAQRPEQLEAGLKSYARLAGLGARLTRKDGTLLLASCSQKVTPEAFQDAVVPAAESAARRRGRVAAITGHAPDHPVRAPGGMPYLKAVFLEL